MNKRFSKRIHVGGNFYNTEIDVDYEIDDDAGDICDITSLKFKAIDEDNKQVFDTAIRVAIRNQILKNLENELLEDYWDNSNNNWGNWEFVDEVL